jgi:hypothetical protein
MFGAINIFDATPPENPPINKVLVGIHCIVYANTATSEWLWNAPVANHSALGK